MKRALVLSLSIVFVAACGGGSKSQPASKANAQSNPCAASSGGETGNGDNGGAGDADSAAGHTKTIKRLMGSIDDKMKQLSAREAKGETLDATCADIEVTDGCTKKCTTTADICKDSKQVCTLAGELSGNTWAADQCKLGKDSCRRAEINCCECKQAG